MSEITIKDKLGIDPKEFHKYVGYFNLEVFGPNGIVAIDDCHVISLSMDIDTAKMMMIYEMCQSCMMELMPLKSIDLIKVYDVDNDKTIHILPSGDNED